MSDLSDVPGLPGYVSPPFATRTGASLTPPVKLISQHIDRVFQTELNNTRRVIVQAQGSQLDTAITVSGYGICNAPDGMEHPILIPYLTTKMVDDYGFNVEGGPTAGDDALLYETSPGNSVTFGIPNPKHKINPFLTNIAGGDGVGISDYGTYPYTNPATGVTVAAPGTKDRTVKKPKVAVKMGQGLKPGKKKSTKQKTNFTSTDPNNDGDFVTLDLYAQGAISDTYGDGNEVGVNTGPGIFINGSNQLEVDLTNGAPGTVGGVKQGPGITICTDTGSGGSGGAGTNYALASAAGLPTYTDSAGQTWYRYAPTTTEPCDVFYDGSVYLDTSVVPPAPIDPVSGQPCTLDMSTCIWYATDGSVFDPSAPADYSSTPGFSGLGGSGSGGGSGERTIAIDLATYSGIVKAGLCDLGGDDGRGLMVNLASASGGAGSAAMMPMLSFYPSFLPTTHRPVFHDGVVAYEQGFELEDNPLDNPAQRAWWNTGYSLAKAGLTFSAPGVPFAGGGAGGSTSGSGTGTTSSSGSTCASGSPCGGVFSGSGLTIIAGDGNQMAVYLASFSGTGSMPTGSGGGCSTSGSGLQFTGDDGEGLGILLQPCAGLTLDDTGLAACYDGTTIDLNANCQLEGIGLVAKGNPPTQGPGAPVPSGGSPPIDYSGGGPGTTVTNGNPGTVGTLPPGMTTPPTGYPFPGQTCTGSTASYYTPEYWQYCKFGTSRNLQDGDSWTMRIDPPDDFGDNHAALNWGPPVIDGFDQFCIVMMDVASSVNQGLARFGADFANETNPPCSNNGGGGSTTTGWLWDNNTGAGWQCIVDGTISSTPTIQPGPQALLGLYLDCNSEMHYFIAPPDGTLTEVFSATITSSSFVLSGQAGEMWGASWERDPHISEASTTYTVLGSINVIHAGNGLPGDITINNFGGSGGTANAGAVPPCPSNVGSAYCNAWSDGYTAFLANPTATTPPTCPFGPNTFSEYCLTFDAGWWDAYNTAHAPTPNPPQQGTNSGNYNTIGTVLVPPTPSDVPTQYGYAWQAGYADHCTGESLICPYSTTTECTYWQEGWDAATGSGCSSSTTNQPTPSDVPPAYASDWQAGYTAFVNKQADTCPSSLDATSCFYWQEGWVAASNVTNTTGTTKTGTTGAGGTSGGTSGGSTVGSGPVPGGTYPINPPAGDVCSGTQGAYPGQLGAMSGYQYGGYLCYEPLTGFYWFNDGAGLSGLFQYTMATQLWSQTGGGSWSAYSPNGLPFGSKYQGAYTVGGTTGAGGQPISGSTGTTSGTGGTVTTTGGAGGTTQSGILLDGDVFIKGGLTVQYNTQLQGNVAIMGTLMIGGAPYTPGYSGGDLEVTGNEQLDGNLIFASLPNPAIGNTLSLSAVAGSGIPVGTHDYVETWVSADGGETLHGPVASIATTSGNANVKVLFGLAPSWVRNRILYRSLVNTSGTWYKVVTVIGAAPTTYTDTASDTALDATKQPPTTNTTKGTIIGLGSATGDVFYRDSTGKLVPLSIGSANQLLTVSPSTGLPVWQNAAAGFTDPETTAGDMIYRNASDITTRLPIGTNGQILGVVSGEPAWTDPSSYSLPIASSTVLGGVKIGANISIAGDGTISVATPYTLPAATTTTLGGVIVGSGLNVSSGTISFANPMTTQDDLIVGGASGALARLGKGADGTVLTVDPTTHHLVWAAAGSGGTGAVATTTTLGAVEIDLNNSAPVAITQQGLLQAAPADATKALVQIGSGGFAGGASDFLGNAAGTEIGVNVPAATGYKVAMLALSPLVYCRMADTSYATMLDISGNGHNGTYSGPAGISTVFNQTGPAAGDGKAVRFQSGTNDYATIPAGAWMPLGSAARWFSFCFKVPPGATGAADWVDQGVDNDHQNFQIYEQNGGQLGAATWGHSGLFSITGFNDSNWHHVVVVYAAGATTATFYLDNVAHTTDFGIVLDTQSGSIILNNNHNLNTGFSDLYMSEFAMGSGTLTGGQVSTLYAALSQSPTANGDFLNFQVAGISKVKVNNAGDLTAGLYNGAAITATTFNGVVPFGDPMTTQGDMLVGTTGGAPQRMAVGSTPQLLGVVSGTPGWVGDTAWTTFTYANSWVDYDSTNYNSGSYRKDPAGWVHLRGLIKNGTSVGATITTLPAGYRPAKNLLFVGWNSGGVAARINIAPTGVVVIDNQAIPAGTLSTSYQSLEGITFFGEQ